MTVLQVFRALLTLVATAGSPKFALQRTAGADEATPSTADHAASSPCVALDSSHCFNVLAGVPACAWRAVQAAAACTLAALSGAVGLSGAAMGTLFQPARCPAVTFDAVARVDVPMVATRDLVRADAPWSACAAKHAEGLLRKALSDRAAEVAVLQAPVSAVLMCTDGTVSALPGGSSTAGLLVGVILNPIEVRVMWLSGMHSASLRGFDGELHVDLPVQLHQATVRAMYL